MGLLEEDTVEVFLELQIESLLKKHCLPVLQMNGEEVCFAGRQFALD
jgi:hypothetical protein